MRRFLLIAAALMLAVSCAADADAHHTPGETETVLTAVMYHDVLASRTGTYIVSPEQLESDIAAFAEAGYSFVSPAQVIAYAEGRGRLPARPMLLTFDDGHYNNAYYGLPILRKYGAKATFCVVGSYADTYTERKSERDNPAYSYLTWEEIGELSRDPLITIAAHSYDMHGAHGRRGILPKAGESDGDYERALTEDTELLREKLTECTGSGGDTYAYPFGHYCAVARETLEGLGYKMFLTCNEGASTLRFGDPSCIKQVCRYNRSGAYATESFLKKIQK